MPEVTGTIRFEPSADAFRDATVFVQLRDTSVADAAARVIAQQVYERVTMEAPAQGRLSFALQPIEIDPRASYTVWVHVDVDGDGKVSSGDLITTQAYPVLTFGHPRQVSIQVGQV